MGQFNVFFKKSWTFLIAVILTLGLAACEGDDGAPGATGQPGTDGTDGTDGDAGIACWDLNGNGTGDLPDEDINGDGAVDVADCSGAAAKVTPLESCGVCHDDGSIADATAFHALDPIELVSNVAIAVAANTTDLEVNFDLAVDDVLTAGYDTMERGYRTDGVTRTTIVDSTTLADNGGGNYTITIAGGAAEAAIDNRYLFRVSAGGERATRVYFYGDFPASPVEDLAISGAACQACHGPEGIDVHGGYFAAEDGGEPCLACHGSLRPDRDNPGELVLTPRLFEIVHEYHSGIRDPITYPTYMNNCSVCHSEEAQLAEANAMSVSAEHCFSCHGSMASWDFSQASFNHAGVNETTDCQICHTEPEVVPGAVATAGEMHNRAALAGRTLGNDGILWNGQDASLVEGKKFDWQITNVDDDEVNLTITWQASYDGVGVDPCNTTVGPGAPVFHDDGRVDENGNAIGRFRTYRNYAQGEDFMLGARDDRPGQPNLVRVTADNTTCAGNVATTIIPVDEDVVAERGRLALNGKPLVVNVADPAGTMEARVPTPTYDWLVGVGGPALDRRSVVDTKKCVGCHVGSLYQHGGDRVDNVDTCLVCHNAAANEKYARAGYGVDASEAYDGKAGEAFEMKTMIHRIHSANYEFPNDRYNSPYLVYRGRGIYAFARDESDVPNWPGDGDDLPVFGGDGAVQDHHFHAPTFPRSLNECTACHTEDDPLTPTVNEDFTIIPDQTKAMASTTDAGGTTWGDLLDDVLQGAATTACVTCHADGAARGHAYQNSWTPQVFPEGRQTIIDAAK